MGDMREFFHVPCVHAAGCLAQLQCAPGTSEKGYMMTRQGVSICVFLSSEMKKGDVITGPETHVRQSGTTSPLLEVLSLSTTGLHTNHHKCSSANVR
jgi:hypothetical protein